MSNLVVVGLNYHATPIAIRERFTIPQSCLRHALAALANLPHVKESVVLSTCNRTEVYAVVTNTEAGLRELESFFMNTQSIASHEVLRPNFKLLRDDVALHLFRVAAGLDSMILGEGQIMSQVKAAHQSALEAKTAGPMLDYLFKQALTCGKRVRSETSLGRRAVSVSSAAIEIARKIFGDLSNRTAVMVGAGKMAQICVKLLLRDMKNGNLFLLNRSPERIERFLTNKFPNKDRLKTGFAFDERHLLSASADLVIVSTNSTNYLLTKESLLSAGRPEKDTVIIDISVPRNVDPEIGELPGIQLYYADDLASVVSKNLAEREALTEKAEQIVFETLDDFHNWQRSLLVVPTIAHLREKIEAIRQEQMAKTQIDRSLSDNDQSVAQIEEISRAIVKQILHHPTVQLKATKDYEILKQQAEALRNLFMLDSILDVQGAKLTSSNHS